VGEYSITQFEDYEEGQAAIENVLKKASGKKAVNLLSF
jgi:hypothetical protein